MKAGDTMTGNLNVSATLITQNIEPVANVTYDLGTSTKRFKDLWLSNSTIYLGEATISANGGNIVVPSIQTSSGVNVEAVLADAYNQANSAFDAANNRVLKAGDTMTGLLNVANSLIVTGNVGIGTATPSYKLDVRDSSTGNILAAALRNTSDASNTTKNVRLGFFLSDTEGSSKDTAYITAYPDGINVLSGGMSFSTRNGDTTPAERLRIASDGNVGIGTNNPGKRLTVFSGNTDSSISGGNDSVRLQVYAYVDGARQTLEWFQTSSSLSLARFGIEWNETANYMNFVWRDVYNAGAGSTELMRLTGTGNLGIGVTNPNGKLQFESNINPRKIVLYEGVNNDYQYYGFGVLAATLAYSTFSVGDDHVFYVGTGTSSREELMRINSTHKCVTIPGQPGFKIAWGSRDFTGGDGRILGTNQGDTIASGRDSFNQGNHFNTATGRFTCPVAGMYTFGISFMRNATNGAYLDVRIYKNGSLTWARAYASPYTSDYQQSMLTMITDANVNDYFEFLIGPTTSIYNDDTYCFGYLIG
jgi:hypothetical protein